MRIRRYSHAFKLQAVRDIESPDVSAAVVVRKYSEIDVSTLRRWLQRFGTGSQTGGAAAPELPQKSGLARLRSELRVARRALAAAQVELGLEKAFLVEACGQMDQEVAAFKKKHAGQRPTGRSRKRRG